MKSCQILELDQFMMLKALDILKSLKDQGVGGRDSIILASMQLYDIQTIATHDKNLLSLTEYRRIDPVLDPPLLLEIGAEFDPEIFDTRTSAFKNKDNSSS